MPAVSENQQQAAGAALAAKRGELSPSDLQGASKDMYESMSEEQLRDFASTETKGLPKKKKVRSKEAGDAKAGLTNSYIVGFLSGYGVAPRLSGYMTGYAGRPAAKK